MSPHSDDSHSFPPHCFSAVNAVSLIAGVVVVVQDHSFAGEGGIYYYYSSAHSSQCPRQLLTQERSSTSVQWLHFRCGIGQGDLQYLLSLLVHWLSLLLLLPCPLVTVVVVFGHSLHYSSNRLQERKEKKKTCSKINTRKALNPLTYCNCSPASLKRLAVPVPVLLRLLPVIYAPDLNCPLILETPF